MAKKYEDFFVAVFVTGFIVVCGSLLYILIQIINYFVIQNYFIVMDFWNIRAGLFLEFISIPQNAIFTFIIFGCLLMLTSWLYFNKNL